MFGRSTRNKSRSNKNAPKGGGNNNKATATAAAAARPPAHGQGAKMSATKKKGGRTSNSNSTLYPHTAGDQHGLRSLLGASSNISLDGQSVLLPTSSASVIMMDDPNHNHQDYDIDDDLSSMNSIPHHNPYVVQGGGNYYSDPPGDKDADVESALAATLRDDDASPPSDEEGEEPNNNNRNSSAVSVVESDMGCDYTVPMTAPSPSRQRRQGGGHQSGQILVDFNSANMNGNAAAVAAAAAAAAVDSPSTNGDDLMLGDGLDFGGPTLTESQSSSESSRGSSLRKSKNKAGRGSWCCCCCPLWVRMSPCWLKAIFMASVLLLMGAAALVVLSVFFGIDVTDLKGVMSSSSAAGEGGDGQDVLPTNPVPTFAPTMEQLTLVGEGSGPTVDESPVTNPPPMAEGDNDDAEPTSSTTDPTADEEVDVVVPTTAAPVVEDTPTTDNTDVATTAPSPIATFYVTGGRYSGEDNNPDDVAQIMERLRALPSEPGEFMVHLGDWNNPSGESECSEISYARAAAMFNASSVPMYFVVGDNEYNDCNDPEQALQFWEQYFVGYESRYWPAPSWEVRRQDEIYGSNFNVADPARGIAYAGINLVGGSIHNAEEWNTRHAANLAWLISSYENFINNNDAGTPPSVFVIFAHASPELQSNNPFYSPFGAWVEANPDTLFVLVHRNLITEFEGLYPNAYEIENLSVVIVRGAVWPPMEITIDTSTSPATITANQEDWLNQGEDDYYN